MNESITCWGGLLSLCTLEAQKRHFTFVFACDRIHAFMKNSSVYKSWLWLMKLKALTWTLYIMVVGYNACYKL